jgi:hypothetical protein
MAPGSTQDGPELSQDQPRIEPEPIVVGMWFGALFGAVRTASRIRDAWNRR